MTKREVKQNRERKVDKNWEEIFNSLNVLEKIQEEGHFYISSSEINNFSYKNGQRIDARNMVKFDYLNSLPWIFASNNLSILPTKRGEYIIGSYKAYEEIESNKKVYTTNVRERQFPEWIESVDYMNLSSEAIMLNVAVISGMFREMFETQNFEQTLSNRMGSKDFSFRIKNKVTNEYDNIDVSGSQIEIDGGYETDNELLLVEAKNGTADSFLIRQLYYPYRLMSSKLHKDVYSLYLQYFNGIFNFNIYKFENCHNYNSLNLVGRFNFRVADEILTIDDIVDTIRSTPLKEQPNVTFPQANSLERIIVMLNAIYDSERGSITKESLTLLNDFTYRQADYYITAGRYLELVEEDPVEKGTYILSKKAENIMFLSSREKKLELIRSIFCYEPFKIIFEKRLESKKRLTADDVYKILKDNKEYMTNYGESTRKRRASTIAKWISEVFDMANDY